MSAIQDLIDFHYVSEPPTAEEPASVVLLVANLLTRGGYEPASLEDIPDAVGELIARCPRPGIGNEQD